MLFTTEFATNLENQRQQLVLAQRTGLHLEQAFDYSIWSFFEESEQQFIRLMTGVGGPEPDEPGDIEFGWCLYFLNGMMPNVPPQVQSSILGPHGIKQALTSMAGMPDSQLTAIEWEVWLNRFEGTGILLGNGSLVSTARYALLDPGWALSVINFLKLKLRLLDIVPFNANSKLIQITARDTLRVALFGDWGTGPYHDGHLAGSPSQLVMQQIQRQKPDMSIHLGDVYYSGMDREERSKLIDAWLHNAPLGNFTLNSNHEMCYGGHGLINGALNPAHTSLFEAQAGSTFFSISFGDWLILGLDSAYYASQCNMFMNGAVTDLAQQKLLQDAGSSGKKIMILTHHNPLTEIGTLQNDLWRNVVSALGKDPDYWYWGHIHNGIVYSEESAGGSVKCRCQGNAAIPVGNAAWLENNPHVSFYTNASLGDTDPRNALRIKNGFALLEFSYDTVKEKWYYQDGSLAWSS